MIQLGRLRFLLLYFLLCTQCLLIAQADSVPPLTESYLFQGRIGEGLVFDIMQDQEGVMWFATEFGLGRYDGQNLHRFVSTPGDTTSLSGNVVYCLDEDKNGKLWVGTHHSGLHTFDPFTETFSSFQHSSENSASIANNNINTVWAKGTERIWAGTRAGGLNLLEKGSRSFQRFQVANSRSPSDNINSLFIDQAGEIWMATDRGVFHGKADSTPNIPFHQLVLPSGPKTVATFCMVDRKGRAWIGTKANGLFVSPRPYEKVIAVGIKDENHARENELYIWEVYQDHHEVIWVASEKGLFYIRPTDTSYTAHAFDLVPMKRVLSLHESRDGVLWVGTNDGVVTLSPRQKKFQFISGKLPGESVPKGRGITIFEKSGTHQIWVGSLRGLLQFDTRKRRLHQDYLSQYPALAHVREATIKSLFQDSRGKLWISTIIGFNTRFEVLCLDIDSGILRDYSLEVPDLQSHVTTHITEDQLGNILFSNDKGLIVFDPNSGRFMDSQSELENSTRWVSNHVSKVMVSKDGTAWVGTDDAGLFSWEASTGVKAHIRSISGDSLSLSSPRIRDIHESRNGHLWIGTDGGLSRLIPGEEHIHQIHNQHGLPENSVRNVIEDQEGIIWMSMPHGIASFDPQTETLRAYEENDGLGLSEFWDQAAFLDESGTLYFGGDGGMICFNPQEVLLNPYQPPVVLTDFRLFNQSVRPDPQSGVLRKAIHKTQEIILPYEKNVLSLHFSALGYINPQKNRYAYQLVGFDKDWQFIGNRTETTYTNLSPGTYLFKIKAANNDGVWGPENHRLSLVILPPWYQSWWANILFIILLGGVVVLGYRYQVKRRLALAENQRLIEIGKLKNQLYTDISHEFRTPLTVILGMTDQIVENPQKWLEKGASLINKNGQHMLGLINQILELSRLESGSLAIQWTHGNIIPFIGYVVESFRSYATTKSIGLHWVAEPKEVWMDYDAEKIQSILTNLIGNAIKYTPTGGEIYIRVRLVQDSLQIRVQDTGIGIPAASLPHIFDRFFRLEGTSGGEIGTGVGLALTHKLVGLLGGNIMVESEEGRGSIFTLLLPVFNHASTEVTPADKNPAALAGSQIFISSALEHDEKPKRDTSIVLIVEDNQDVATYLTACLQDRHEIIWAKDGLEGCEVAFQNIPDLIISDVMMPKRDGYELCQTLKADMKTSHIPIILLTAKADMESRLSGLQRGADAYLAKPFDKRELLIRTEKLLESRRQMQAYFLQHQGGGIISLENAAPKWEHTFIRKTRELIETQLDQGEPYSIEDLAYVHSMSTSQLYRKMKALTGLSPIRFVRHIQLERAKKLLADKSYSISDIAYQTGFRDPAYFSRVFTTETGRTPSDFREKLG